MDFMLHLELGKPASQISYKQKILLTGSCFTEHIGNSLQQLKFPVLQNPNGILFDPASVSKSLISYVENKQYSAKDFFQLNDVWHSWDHHSRFSNTTLDGAIEAVNNSQGRAHEFVRNADWIIITLGSSFSYRLTQVVERSKASSPAGDPESALGVANCHRAPAQWFDKHLLTVEDTRDCMQHALRRLFEFNPKLRIIFTVSPVRHARDGVVENNRSKARLIESVHQLVEQNPRVTYFPAYELVIDVLRDYRFYDVDLVHPNYMATEFVMEKFVETFMDEPTRNLMEQVKDIVLARRHKAFQPETKSHQQFLKTFYEKTKQLQAALPFLDLQEELNYFSSGC